MKSVFTALVIVALVLAPLVVSAQNFSAGTQAPIAQPLLREGTMAVDLADVLGLGTTTSETEAESLLIRNGIAPRNGWIADYPVTPDIADELREAVTKAVASGSVKMTRDAASQAFDGVLSGYDLNLRSDKSGEAVVSQTEEAYPDTAAVNNYYVDEGPPVVTYYTPPFDYLYLYSWVNYPFWWSGFWFPGFFVLADFDFDHGHGRHHDRDDIDRHHNGFVNNHFRDPKTGIFSRIDPAHRANGGNLPVIGDKGRPNPVSRRGAESIFNRSVTTPRTQGTISRGNGGNIIAPTVDVPSNSGNGFRGARSRIYTPNLYQGGNYVHEGMRAAKTPIVPQTNARVFNAPAPQHHFSASAPRMTTSSFSGGERAFTPPASSGGWVTRGGGRGR